MSDWRRYAEVHGPEHTVSGTVLVLPELRSPQRGNAREILVWLPPSLGLPLAVERHYPVL